MPRSKKDTVRIIDTKPEVIGGGTLQTQALTIAPPPIGEVAAPSNLVAVASGVARSPVKPEAYVNVSWRSPLGTVPTYYDIEYGRSSEWNSTTKTFSNPQRVQSYNLAATLSLGLDTAYRIRVRSVYRNTTSAWTDTVQVTTADDTTPTSAVTNVATNWNPITGDLTITWTNPTDVQFRDARVRIYSDAGKSELYRTVFSTSGRYVYTYAQNLQDSTTGDPSVHITVDSRNWAGSGTIYSTAVDVSTSLNPPSTAPTASVTTNGSTGSSYWSWSTIADTVGYNLTIDSITRQVYTLQYEYSITQNRIEHGGLVQTALTLVDDSSQILIDTNNNQLRTDSTATLIWSLTAFDIFNQESPAATGSITFPSPSVPSGLVVNFDNPDCVFRWTLGTDVTGYQLSIDGVVRDLGLVDRFTYTLGQNTSEHTVVPNPPTPDHTLTYILTGYNALGLTASTASANITSPVPNAPTAVTLTAYFNVLAAVITGHVRLPTHYRYKFEFRKDGATHKTIYSTENTASLEINQTGSYIVRVSAEDVFSRSSGTLDSAVVVPDVLTLEELREDAIYSDSIGTAPATLDALKDNNTTSGGVTYALGAGWKWTRFERPMLDRYRTVTAGLFSPTADTRIYFSTSSDNSTWQWWSGIDVNGDVASVANESTAQTNAITIGTTYATTTRWDLASIVEARYIRIHHRNTVANYTIREFYPRRLIQSDDIEAESILAINIAAGTITGNKIAANTITATNIAANTITTQKLLVSGTGMSLTDDPNTVDISAWSGGTFTLVTDADSPNGNALQVTSQGATTISNTYIPIDTAKNYIARIWCRQVSGTPLSYLFIAFFDASQALIQNSPIPLPGWGGGTFHYWGRINQLIPSTWTEYTISFGPNETPQIPATAKYIRIGMLANFNAAGTSRFTRFIVAEKTTGSLIVDGTITATKIAANTITGDKISSATTITAGTSPNVGVLDGTGTWRIYAGNTNPTLAPFRVSQTGQLIATGADISGAITVTGGNASTIGQRITGLTGLLVPGVVIIDNASLAILDNDNKYITDDTITNTVSWYNATLYAADGSSYALTNANTTITQRTYLIWTAGGTTLTASTTPPTTDSSVLVATVEPGSIAANIQAPYASTYISGEWINTGSITAKNILANTITADQIAAGSITADRMNVIQLSALSADLGDITAGTITGTTITGATIQTSSGTGARVVLDSTGLTTYNSSNQVQIEATTANNGELRAGQGNVVIDRNGITVAQSAGSGFIRFENNAGNTAAILNLTSTEFLIAESDNKKLSIYNFTSSPTGSGGDVELKSLFGNVGLVAESTLGILNFRVGASVTATIDPLYGFTINSSGIRFNNSVTTEVNTLDDYEEGSWSPTYTTDGTNFTSVTYTANRLGRYTKVGQLVTAWFTIQTSAITVGSASGNLMIGGLPFTSANISGFYQTGSTGAHQAFAVNYPTAIVVNLNDTRAFIYYRATAAGATTPMTATDLATGANSNLLYGTVIYRV